MALDFDSLKSTIIGFTAIVGDGRGDKATSKSLFEEQGVAWQFVKTMPRGKYGSGIDLFLISLFVDIFSAMHAAIRKRDFSPEIQFDKALFLSDLQLQIDFLRGLTSTIAAR
jgi:hypothetical protein